MGRIKPGSPELEERIRRAFRAARLQCPPTKHFARLLAAELGWESVGRQAIYGWEAGDRIPATVLLAAAQVVGRSVDELLGDGERILVLHRHRARASSSRLDKVVAE